jgi:hypothetical protein
VPLLAVPQQICDNSDLDVGFEDPGNVGRRECNRSKEIALAASNPASQADHSHEGDTTWER